MIRHRCVNLVHRTAHDTPQVCQFGAPNSPRYATGVSIRASDTRILMATGNVEVFISCDDEIHCMSGYDELVAQGGSAEGQRGSAQAVRQEERSNIRVPHKTVPSPPKANTDSPLQDAAKVAALLTRLQVTKESLYKQWGIPRNSNVLSKWLKCKNLSQPADLQ